MSQPTIRLMILENGSEAMSLDIAFEEMKGCLDSYFFCVEKLLSPEEFESYMAEVRSMINGKGTLQ